MLGYALGVIGLPRDEFRRLTIEEFDAVCFAHTRHTEELEQSKWERMRMLATIVIQPHVKDRLTAKDLMKFPWDKKTEPEEVCMTHDERLEAAHDALKRFG